MRRCAVVALLVLSAFAAGVGCGFRLAKGVDSDGGTVSVPRRTKTSRAVPEVKRPLLLREDETTVEVVSDGSPEPSPEIAAAHAERRARRQAVREAKEVERLDFLSSLNVELLAEDQRARHADYQAARETRASVRREIADLRARGEEVPEVLQGRLADAESLLRADRDAEQRLLREAAARAAGLDESVIRQLMDDLSSIDGIFDSSR